MERVSAFMDGQLESIDVDGQVTRLKEDPELRSAWDIYHLIGDAIRGDMGLSPDFTSRVVANLAQEPIVLAPRPRKSLQTMRRFALPAAASMGGIALVAWLAFFSNPFAPQENLALRRPTPTAPSQTQIAASPANGAVNDYLLAHQQFSPSTAMQGVASYVRTVSVQDVERR